jgi:hypothetical protein
MITSIANRTTQLRDLFTASFENIRQNEPDTLEFSLYTEGVDSTPGSYQTNSEAVKLFMHERYGCGRPACEEHDS